MDLFGELPAAPSPETHPNRFVAGETDPAEADRFWATTGTGEPDEEPQASVFDAVAFHERYLPALQAALEPFVEAGVPFALCTIARLESTARVGEDGWLDLSVDTIATAGGLAAPEVPVLSRLVRGYAIQAGEVQSQFMLVQEDSNAGAIVKGLMAGHGSAN